MWTKNGLEILKRFYTEIGIASGIPVTLYNGTSTTATLENSTSSKTYRWQFFATDVGSGGVSFGYAPSMYLVSNMSTWFAGNTSGTSTPDPTSAGVIFGDGDTPPSLNDYNLSGNIITDFTATTAITTDISDGKLKGIATYNITNTGASPITIKEIGFRVYRTWTPTTDNWVLVYRDVLATPVTIAPGDTGVVTYKIEIS